MLHGLPVKRKRPAIPRFVIIKPVKPPNRLPRRKVLDGSSHIPGLISIELVLDDVFDSGNTLRGVEEANLVEELRAAIVEVRESSGVGVGLGDDGLEDLGGDDEAVLVDAGDSGELFDGGRGEAVAEERGDEWRVLVPGA